MRVAAITETTYQMREARQRRPRLQFEDKMLTSWNGESSSFFLAFASDDAH
jgi:uncharacterized protein YyaL (SSP411 family)